jgi:hypothetical protein
VRAHIGIGGGDVERVRKLLAKLLR